MQSIKVRHNCEMAHRLFETPGKCENIHGHSWWVELEIGGDVDEHGLLGGIDFGIAKMALRSYLDDNFDHRVLLNEHDQFAGDLTIGQVDLQLPGLKTMEGDPTTENFAKMIGQHMRALFGLKFQYRVTVWETKVNAATWEG